MFSKRPVPGGHAHLKSLFPGLQLALFKHGLAEHSSKLSLQYFPVNPGCKIKCIPQLDHSKKVILLRALHVDHIHISQEYLRIRIIILKP